MPALHASSATSGERVTTTRAARAGVSAASSARQDYGMIRFDAEPFDVEESYMRLMMES